MRDIKYLAAFSIPIVAFISVYIKGPFSYLTLVYGFIIIPILELLFPQDNSNLTDKEANKKSTSSIFNWLLYINLPIVYGLLIFTLYRINTSKIDVFEFIGFVFSVGIVLSVNGINVAHELGHRLRSPERFLGKALLLPSLYMHFFIEHNFGHHLHAATNEDPATAKYNQSVYSFWFTSISGQYISAWKIQLGLMRYKKISFFNLKNDMFYYLILQICYLACILVVFNLKGLLFAVSAGIIGWLLLETVNYIEHYGLRRLKLASGRYERVQEMHSWNSNHVIGRIVLYELTRHSDHHYKSNKKYQLLNCHEESPQMPYGYPTSMVISLIPPLWFKIMNKRIPKKMIV